jgi:hypothetical protein
MIEAQAGDNTAAIATLTMGINTNSDAIGMNTGDIASLTGDVT